MDLEQAMTELDAAVADRSKGADEARTLRVAAAIYELSVQPGVKQRDLVQRTGYKRETIRRHIEDERIRRGLIPPTERYLRAQERASRS